MPRSDYTVLSALDPFFDMVMEGLVEFVGSSPAIDLCKNNEDGKDAKGHEMRKITVAQNG